MVAGDAVQVDTNATGAEDVTTNSENELVTTDTPVTKDIDATGAAFTSDVQAAIEDGVARVTTKAGYGGAYSWCDCALWQTGLSGRLGGRWGR